MAVMTSFLSLLEPLTEPKRLVLLPSHGEANAASGLAAQEDESEVLPDQAEELIVKAQHALIQAQADADEMREDALVQAEALREAAWQEGFHEGKTSAHSQVEAELRTQWDAERVDFRAQAQALLESIVQQRQALWESQEAEMVGFVLDITRQVIKTEVMQNPEIVTNILHNAMRRITDKESVRIRVSVADAPRIREMRNDLLTLVDGIKHLEILDDRRIGEGGCVVETGAGTIDAKIETQLAEVERALNHALAG